MTSATIHPVLVGLDGWHRWSSWSAHFFVDGVQSCRTLHGIYMGGGFAPKRPAPAELTPQGVPYGRVCDQCLKASRGAR
jgi:hypothetical protein